MDAEEKPKASYLGEVDRGWFKSGVIVVALEPQLVEFINSAIIDAFEAGVDSVCVLWGDPSDLGQGLLFGVECVDVCAYHAAAHPAKLKSFAIKRAEE